MKITYYAWLANDFGTHEENIEDESLKTVHDLIEYLKNQTPRKNEVFSNLDKLCISVNNELLDNAEIVSENINDSDQISFFPPISGG